MWNSDRLDYSEVSYILPRAVKGGYVAEGPEKCKFLGSLLDKEVKTLENHGYPKSQDLVEEQIWIC